MHLAARLAERFNAPAEQIAEAMAARNLRAGQGMDESQARVFSRQLEQLGAQTELRPALQGRSSGAQSATSRVTSTAVSAPATVALSATPGNDLVGRDPFSPPGGAPSGPVAAAPAVAGPPTVGAPVIAGSAGPAGMPGPATMGLDSTQTAPSQTIPSLTRGGSVGTLTALGGAAGTSIGVATRAEPAPRTTAAPAITAGSATQGQLARLELGRPLEDTQESLPLTRAVESNVGLAAASVSSDGTTSGLSPARDNKAQTVRCPEHGLFYDKNRASGCRKCLAPSVAKAKKMAKRIDRGSHRFAIAWLRADPTKHALAGLGLSLGVGLVPAAFYAFNVGQPRVEIFRAEQAELSKKVGTEEILGRYHELDTLVHEFHSANLRNTAIIWLVAGSLVLVGWHRFT